MENKFDFSQVIIFKTFKGYDVFQNSQIIRIEAERNCALVYLLNEDKPQKILHSFSKIEKKIANCNCFYKCHRSHIVNTNHIRRFQEKTSKFVTENGEVPISETYFNEVKEKFCK